MRYDNIIFPHPVLRINDDSIKGKIEYEPEITEDENYYNIFIKFNVDNGDILSLIESGKAEYLVEVNCSDTLFRKVYTSSENKLQFRIPTHKVKGKVIFDNFIVAKEPIPDYKNSEAHPDYKDYVINIEKGDVLAFFGSFDFTAQIDYKKLKAVASFMEVVEGDGEYTDFDLDADKILIKLPKEEYKLFQQPVISKEPGFAPVFHSSLVLNALIVALYNYDEYKDRLWAQAVKYRMDNDEELQDYSFDDEAKIPEIAQALLGNPFGRLLKQLDENVSQNEDEE